MRLTLLLAALIALTSFNTPPRKFVQYKSNGRILKIPYGSNVVQYSWHTYTDDVCVTFEISNKVAYISKYRSEWKYRKKSGTDWWYTHGNHDMEANAMRWFFDCNSNAIFVEYYHRNNKNDSMMTRREVLLDVSRDTIWR